jgi:hypothetical protein
MWIIKVFVDNFERALFLENDGIGSVYTVRPSLISVQNEKNKRLSTSYYISL